MRVLINTTSVHKGGGLQKVSAFLEEMQADTLGYNWSVAIHCSQVPIVDRLRIEPHLVTNCRPSRSQACARQLANLESEFRPDVILTLCGPRTAASKLRI